MQGPQPLEATRTGTSEGCRTVVSCRICGSGDLALFLSLGGQPHCNSFLSSEQLAVPEPRWPLDLLFCRRCSLVQLGHVVDRDLMFRNYLYVSGTTQTLSAHFTEMAQRLVSDFDVAPGQLVVDIGSNDGTFLRQFSALGLQVLGVDPATNVADRASQAGVRTVNDYFGLAIAKQIRAEEGEAQLMTAAGVFFHIDDMDDVCQGVAALLAPDGVFEVQAIYLGGMLEKRSFDNVYHEHLSYYTLAPLIWLFERFSLEIFDVRHSSIHGGTLVARVGHSGAHPVRRSVEDWLSSEREKRYDTLEPYQRFAREVAAIRRDLIALIASLRSRGKRVAAYGAPAKGNTLLNFCGFGADTLEYAAEVAPLKIGLFTPGTHLPVIDESVAFADPPDYFLLLPWNFSDELLSKNRSYLDNGGHFIIPIPVPRIV